MSLTIWVGQFVAGRKSTAPGKDYQREKHHIHCKSLFMNAP